MPVSVQKGAMAAPVSNLIVNGFEPNDEIKSVKANTSAFVYESRLVSRLFKENPSSESSEGDYLRYENSLYLFDELYRGTKVQYGTLLFQSTLLNFSELFTERSNGRNLLLATTHFDIGNLVEKFQTNE